MASTEDGEGFTSEQRSGLEARQLDQDRTLEAMHRLEGALSEAAPAERPRGARPRSRRWACSKPRSPKEATNAEQPDSLLSDLARTQPRLLNRARALRLEYRKLCETIATLPHEIAEHSDSGVDFAHLRERLGWVLTALRHQRARESDLICEAYYEAFKVELRTPPPSDAHGE
jgi:hypothetical protein